jgi:hypothetical protein
MKQQDYIYGISKTKYAVFATKHQHLFPYSKILCLRMKILFLEFPSLGSPEVTINMIQN